jgi:hypothetical protein
MGKCHFEIKYNAMKTSRFLSKFFLSGLFLIFLFSCNHKSDFISILIKVDSIQVPNQLTVNVPFEIKFFGTIGGDGCYSFSNFNVQIDNNNILIEAWGKIERAIICPTVIVYLTGHNQTYTIQNTGTYNLKIKQPDNSYLEKQITVN